MNKAKKKIILSEKRLARIKKVVGNRQKDVIVVLEDIYDPHNAGAILRTCEGLGIQKVFFIFKKIKEYNPKRIGRNSSSSANKWLDFEIFKSTKRCLNKLKRNDYEIFAAVLDEEAKNLYKTNFLKKEKIAILVGNEHNGLSEEAISLADKKIYIPMKGFVQSFNVSVTTAIFLYELTRQRMNSRGNYLLGRKDTDKLTKDFIKRAS